MARSAEESAGFDEKDEDDESEHERVAEVDEILRQPCRELRDREADDEAPDERAAQPVDPADHRTDEREDRDGNAEARVHGARAHREDEGDGGRQHTTEAERQRDDAVRPDAQHPGREEVGGSGLNLSSQARASQKEPQRTEQDERRDDRHHGQHLQPHASDLDRAGELVCDRCRSDVVAEHGLVDALQEG